MLRRIDGTVDQLGDDIRDIKQRLTSVGRQIGALRVDMAGLSARMHRFNVRVERIERRLDVAEASMKARALPWTAGVRGAQTPFH
jgi:septal ring factor EnvC (AmiA/AmiB activator)